VRGNRRFYQNPAEPSAAVLAEMRARDERDRSRTISPLVPAKDAILIDSTNMTLDEVIERAEQVVKESVSRVVESSLESGASRSG
jgi:cytidylate kinase